MPAPIVATEQATALLRAHLRALGLDHYRVSFCRDLALDDVESHLDGLADGEQWQPAPPLSVTCATEGAANLSVVVHQGPAARRSDGGFLRLDRLGVVIARWFYVTPETYQPMSALTLVAAESDDAHARIASELATQRRRQAQGVWQAVRGYIGSDDPPTPRTASVGDDELLLSPSLRERITVDVLKFFTDDVASLYRGLAVPYRRGVLLHGPPGNGKTSLIRAIGAGVPHIPALLLRPGASFDSDDLKEVVRRWREQAPAMLVIEDLDWLIDQVNVSTFLNLIDGIDTTADTDGGLLLIATTNHPEKLDPAINSRPGRFDVVIDVPNPDRALRIEFLRRKLPSLGAAALEQVVRAGDGFSFAHLHEILRLSGLYAIAAGRSSRHDDDVTRAARELARTRDQADRGFAPTPEIPFGLAALHARK